MNVFLGIDLGTQGLSALLIDESYKVIAEGSEGYEMISGLESNCYEQWPNDWINALVNSMKQIKRMLRDKKIVIKESTDEIDRNIVEETSGSSVEWNIVSLKAIGISGQMHGEVLVDINSNIVLPARLWCDGRNEKEAEELTALFNTKCPKRLTACRWLDTIRNKPYDIVSSVRHITTPAGWIAHTLTGEWNLGVGDASGIFPIDQISCSYDEELLRRFDHAIQKSFSSRFPSESNLRNFLSYLPTVKRVGEFGGILCSVGSSLLGLSGEIQICPAEGDQPASLAGSLIGNPGQVSMSFGTSVVCNSVCDKKFSGISRNVDHFMSCDGKPINMIWLRNGTTPMNMIIRMFSSVFSHSLEQLQDPFSLLMPLIVAAPHDCEGVMASPFMDDEPNMGISNGGSCGIFHLNQSNAKPGNVAKAMLLATLFNLRIGCDILSQQEFQRTEINLTGGIAKTRALGQLVADVFNTPVTILESADEGCAWGAAILAVYRHYCASCHDSFARHSHDSWAHFLDEVKCMRFTNQNAVEGSCGIRFVPNSSSVKIFDSMLQKHHKLISLHEQIVACSTI